MNIRLGELDLLMEKDCDKYGDEEECADQPVDVLVDKVMPHKDFDVDTLKNDIALIKTRTKITFTGDYFFIFSRLSPNIFEIVTEI